MQFRPVAENADASLLHDEINRVLLSLLRAALAVGLIGNFVLGTTDFLFESVPDIRIFFLRWALIAVTTALLIATYMQGAARWAVSLSLAALFVGCVVAIGPLAMHGDLQTPMVLSLALAAAVSTAAPWGVKGQLAATVTANAAMIGTLALVTGDLRVTFDAYPTMAAAIIFPMSLYGATVCRRTYELSIERGVALARSTKTVEVREAQIREQLVQLDALNADLERRVLERTTELASANTQLEQESLRRHHTLEELRRNQEQLRAILDNTTAVIYLKDTAGRYMLINSQYETLFHVSRESIIGQTDYDMFPPDVAEAVRQNDRQVLAADRPLVFEEATPLDDGILHTYVSVKFPLRDERGIAYGVCGISTDITPRKQMEAQLQVSQAQLSALIENTSDAIWSIDDQYRVVVINSVAAQWFREIFGTPFQLDAPFGQRAPEAETARWRVLYDRALSGERVVFEQQYTKQGDLRSYLTSMTPIVADQHTSGATVFAKDITEIKRAEERVREHQAALSHMLRLRTVGEMAAGLAHEINQPLAAISNYARGCRNRILSGETPPEQLVPVLDEIAAQALRAGEIIRRLRSMVEKRAPTRETLDLNEVTTEAVHMVESQIRQQGVRLSLELASDLPATDMDRIQIEQVIVNLLLNSLEAMQTVDGRAHHVTVRTGRGGDRTVEVVVQDTGSGIAHTVREKMFEPFFTIKKSGLGMGLTISRSIVEAHGGRIWADNNPDCGAQVHLVLPSPMTESAA